MCYLCWKYFYQSFPLISSILLYLESSYPPHDGVNIHNCFLLVYFSLFLLRYKIYIVKCTKLTKLKHTARFICTRVHLCNHHVDQDTEHFCHSFQSVPTQGNHYPDLYYHQLVLLVLELHINVIIYSIFFCALLSLNIMVVRIIPIV